MTPAEHTAEAREINTEEYKMGWEFGRMQFTNHGSIQARCVVHLRKQHHLFVQGVLDGFYSLYQQSRDFM